MKIYISFILIVIFSKLQSQTKYSESLLAKSNTEFNNFNYNTSYQLASKAIEYAKKENNQEILLKSNILLAKISFEKGDLFNALKKLDEIEEIKINTIESFIEIKKVKGKIFREMNLFEASKNEFLEQLQKSHQLSEDERYLNKILAHESLMKLHKKTGNEDSMKIHLYHQIELLQYLNITKTPQIFYTCYLNYANYLINQNDFKNAGIYLNNSKSILEQHKLKNSYPYHFTKAKFEFFNENIVACEEHLLKALELSKLQGIKKKELEIYENMFLFNVDSKHLTKNILSYTLLNKSLSKDNTHLNNLAYQNILKNQQNKNNDNLAVLFSIFILIFILLLIVFIYFYHIKQLNIDDTIKKSMYQNLMKI